MHRTCVILANAALLFAAGCGSSFSRPTTPKAPDPVKVCVLEPIPDTGSIWPAANRPDFSWIADVKGHFKGDLVTIVISENLNASQSGTTARERDGTLNAAVTQLFFPNVGTIGGNNANIGYTTKRTDSGTAQITNTNAVTASLAAQITEVLPNGNLMLCAKKEIMYGGELQKVTVTGIARPESISSPANQIQSTDIAEARIFVDGTGPLSDAQRRTLVSRLGDFFNIF
jgi:flagellar L-ring protein precursor FlgH